MRNIKEIIRLYEAGIKKKKIANITGITRKTVRDYLERAERAGLKYDDIEKLSSKEIYAQLFPISPESMQTRKTQPDWSQIHQEMKKKNVTLTLLWEEFIQANPEGVRSSQFSYHYNQWKKKIDLSMRQVHKFGEKCFVDYAGHTIPIIDQSTGESRKAQIFVAVLGASNYTYAEATWTQSIPNWTSSHVNTFEYFGGVPELVIPDNLKSGVNKACRYEPEINNSYHDLAMHYGVAIMPTRVRKPKDCIFNNCYFQI
ncbi:MAG: IS21 family transposase [Bacteroidota bacterium]|nr:IS21 family transposase [Bacteroidota bacterium]